MDDLTDQEKLQAWYEWRKWCSIWRVLEPGALPEEEGIGIRDEGVSGELRKQFYGYLRTYLFAKVRNIIHEQDLDRFISCFDTYMKGSKPDDTNDFRAARNPWSGSPLDSFKDYVFYLVEHPTIPGSTKLKVIYGKIREYLSSVLKKFYLEEHTSVHGQRDNELENPKILSLDEANDDGRSLLNILEDENETAVPEEVSDKVVASILALVPDKRERYLLWATGEDLAISGPEVEAYTGRKKSANCEALEKVLRKLRTSEYADLLSGAMPKIWKILQKELGKDGKD